MRQIDFDGKKNREKFQFWNESEDIDDMLVSNYGEPVSPSLSHRFAWLVRSADERIRPER